MEQLINYKIDWLSLMCQDVSIIDIMDTFIPDPHREDLLQVWQDRFVCSTTMGTVVQLKYDSMLVQIPITSIYESFTTFDPDVLDPFEFAESRFTKMRVDFSGQALDMIRSFGFDVESILNTGVILPHGSCHITRCDHAFDLINYRSNFLDDCIDFCNNHHSEAAKPRVSCGLPSGLGYSIRTGDQKTLYLGGGASDKCLRIYDKKLQYEQSNKFISSCPYGTEDDRPDSWIRIELQTRRSLAQGMIDTALNAEHIFKYIFETFSLRLPGRNSKPSEMWLSLFDWETITAIIQNANKAVYETVIEKAVTRVRGNAFSAIVTVVSVFGWKGFISMIEAEFARLQRSKLLPDQLRWNKLIDTLHSFDLNDGYKCPPYLLKNGSEYKFSEIGEAA